MQNLACMQQLQPRMEAATNKLSRFLSVSLDAALRMGHRAATMHCLHAYASVGDAASAEQVGVCLCSRKQAYMHTTVIYLSSQACKSHSFA